MSANQKGHPTRLEYLAAFGMPHPWLWWLVPAGAWALLYGIRDSMSETVYIAIRSTIVLLLAYSLFGCCLRLLGVRPAPKPRRNRPASPEK